MRLFLLPISTRRTLIYCERLQPQITPGGKKPPLTERVIDRASETWAKWERAEKGWQKYVANWGNQLFRRIPYEEWGLKSLPPLNKQRKSEIEDGKLKAECLFPGRFLDAKRVPEVLKQLATERQSLHSRNLWYCLIGMPISFPFTFVPIIPNLPFYYLVFRAWSHYRALYGSRLLQHMLTKDAVTITPSSKLDDAYAAGLLHPSLEAYQKSRSEVKSPAEELDQAVKEVESKGSNKETLLLQKWNGTQLAESLRLPAMEIEIERAVEQIEKALSTKAPGEAKKDQQ